MSPERAISRRAIARRGNSLKTRAILGMSCAIVLLGRTGWTQAAPSAQSRTPAASQLQHLVATQWQREMRETTLEASADGFHAYDGLWPAVSPTPLAREPQEDMQEWR